MRSTTAVQVRWLSVSVAIVWLATGFLVLHPHYRSVGGAELARLGLPRFLMPLTCAAEVAIGLRVALGRPVTWLVALQVAMVAGFTAILGATQPALLVHPFGILTKNIPLVAVLVTSWLLDREGWTGRAVWVLRAGMAAIWITEGLLPKILFQQPLELAVVAGSGLVPIDPARFLTLLGVAQISSGVLALTLRGRWLRFVLWAQVAALVLLPLLVSWQDPLLWVHPFGPMTKNFPIVAGTALLAFREAAC